MPLHVWTVRARVGVDALGIEHITQKYLHYWTLNIRHELSDGSGTQ